MQDDDNDIIERDAPPAGGRLAKYTQWQPPRAPEFEGHIPSLLRATDPAPGGSSFRTKVQTAALITGLLAHAHELEKGKPHRKPAELEKMGWRIWQVLYSIGALDKRHVFPRRWSYAYFGRRIVEGELQRVEELGNVSEFADRWDNGGRSAGTLDCDMRERLTELDAQRPEEGAPRGQRRGGQARTPVERWAKRVVQAAMDIGLLVGSWEDGRYLSEAIPAIGLDDSGKLRGLFISAELIERAAAGWTSLKSPAGEGTTIDVSTPPVTGPSSVREGTTIDGAVNGGADQQAPTSMVVRSHVNGGPVHVNGGPQKHINKHEDRPLTSSRTATRSSSAVAKGVRLHRGEVTRYPPPEEAQLEVVFPLDEAERPPLSLPEEAAPAASGSSEICEREAASPAPADEAAPPLPATASEQDPRPLLVLAPPADWGPADLVVVRDVVLPGHYKFFRDARGRVFVVTPRSVTS